MGSDLGPPWGEQEPRVSKMVFIGIELPRDIFLQGLNQCLVASDGGPAGLDTGPASLPPA